LVVPHPLPPTSHLRRASPCRAAAPRIRSTDSPHLLPGNDHLYGRSALAVTLIFPAFVSLGHVLLVVVRVDNHALGDTVRRHLSAVKERAGWREGSLGFVGVRVGSLG